jgi:hypothetical protein
MVIGLWDWLAWAWVCLLLLYMCTMQIGCLGEDILRFEYSYIRTRVPNMMR